jgi:hypothetical protein
MAQELIDEQGGQRFGVVAHVARELGIGIESANLNRPSQHLDDGGVDGDDEGSSAGGAARTHCTSSPRSATRPDTVIALGDSPRATSAEMLSDHK